MLDNRDLLEPFTLFTDQISFALSLQERIDAQARSA